MTQSSATIDTTTQEGSEATAPLGFGDFCDSCGAQAYVRVTLPSGVLLFCAHHGDKHRDNLSDSALVWHDETHRLRDESAS